MGGGQRVEGSTRREEDGWMGGVGGGALNPTRIPNCVLRSWSTSDPPFSIYPHFHVGEGEKKKEPVKSFVDTALGVGLSRKIEYQGRECSTAMTMRDKSKWGTASHRNDIRVSRKRARAWARARARAYLKDVRLLIKNILSR